MIFLIWLLIASVFTAIALVRISIAPQEGQGEGKRPFVLLRPVDAATAIELENLAQPNAGIVISGPASLHNRKLGHVQTALATLELNGRALLIADADVRVDERLINSLVAALDAGAELAWAAPSPESSGLARSLFIQSIHSFRSLDALSDHAKPVCGKAMALGPKAIELFRALPDCVGEDLELSRKLHRLQLKVTFAGEAVIPGPAAPWGTQLARFTRWMQVLKAHRPHLFPTIPLLFAATPILTLAALLDRSPPMVAGALILIALRMTLAAVLERRPGIFLGWFGAELLLLCSWTNALLLGSKVTWRGRVLEVGEHGRLTHSGSAS